MPYTATRLEARIKTHSMNPVTERNIQSDERDTDEDESRSGSYLGIFEDEGSGEKYGHSVRKCLTVNVKPQ